jgi:Ca2+-binding RTX toxin-like protein
MTRIVGNILGGSDIIGIDMDAWDFGEMAAAVITTHTDETVTFTADWHTYTLEGHNFTYDGSGALTGGTVTRFVVTQEGSTDPDFTILRFKMDAVDFMHFVSTNNVDGFQRELFGKVDGYRGGASIDVLNGMGGGDFISGGDSNDRLYGNKGDDELQGDRGADLLVGGKGDDRFYYSNAGDSTAGTFDTIEGFNVNQDRFMLPIIVEGVEAAVTGSGATFDAGLVTALPAASLDAYHAAVATITAGAETHVFLVVDLNGVAGYQSGGDVAVIIDGARDLNTLAIDNFILTSQH